MLFSQISMPPQWIRRDGDDQLVTVVMATTTQTGVTGITTGDVTIRISKAGGAFAAPSDGAWSELDNGFYTIQLDQDDCDTLGTMLIRVDDGSNPVALRVVEVGLNADDVLNQYLRIRSFFKERK